MAGDGIVAGWPGTGSRLARGEWPVPDPLAGICARFAAVPDPFAGICARVAL